MESISININNIDWNDVIKKKARGSGEEDLGKVQQVGQNYVLVQRGIINKQKLYIPKDMAESYDGDVLHFKISEEEAKDRFMRDSLLPPSRTTVVQNEDYIRFIDAWEKLQLSH